MAPMANPNCMHQQEVGLLDSNVLQKHFFHMLLKIIRLALFT